MKRLSKDVFVLYKKLSARVGINWYLCARLW